MSQWDTEGYGNGKDHVFNATGYYRGCRDYSEPTSVTPE